MNRSILRAAFLLLSGVFLLASCSSYKRVLYFQDISAGLYEIPIAAPTEITLRSGDKISIIVNSRDPQLMDLFNLPYVSRQLGMSSRTGVTTASTQGITGYTIDDEGNIDFPVLGKIKVAGMTREEVTDYIKNELINNNLVKDPVVTVEYMNLCISVMGEVNNPGRFNIDRDCITVIDALSMAGDLTIYGNRNNVLVQRIENGVMKAYSIDLTSGEQVYTSPAYYLMQDDVVYVEPNEYRKSNSTYNSNKQFNVSMISTIISGVSVIASLIIALFVK